MPLEVPEPWRSFLRDLDDAVPDPIALHCLGGFVVAMKYGMPRPTADIDVLAVTPDPLGALLLELAGRGSKLHAKHEVYLDFVVLRVEPADYRIRLTEMFSGGLHRLRLMALDPYDLALTKLDRNIPRDREDFFYLAEAVPLDLTLLRARYDSEIAPYVFEAVEKTLRLTLELWIEAAEERRRRPRPEHS